MYMWKKVRTFIASGQFEGYFWLAAIAMLATTDPDHCGHYSLCLFKNLGIDFCPGCGLGTSIALLFRGRPADSFASHPLAIPAVIFLLYRSFQLLVKPKLKRNTDH